MSENKDQKPAALDVMPEADDDLEPTSGAPAAPADAPSQQPAEAAEPVSRDPFAEERERAALRYRELRDEAAAEQAAAATEDSDDTPADATPTGGAPEQTVELTVHGKKLQVPLSQVVATAQKNLAADERLEEAKRLANEVKSLHAQQTSEPRHQPRVPPDGSRREKLREIAERIQVGDTEDGADALAELISDQANIEQRVDQRLADRQIQREVGQAVENFKQNFPAVVNSPLLTKAAMSAAGEELQKDLVKAGVPKDYLAPFAENTEALVQLHRAARAHGKPVRSYDQILTSTGKRLASEFNIPVGGGNSAAQSRLERKRAAPSQPRSAGISRGMDRPKQGPKSSRDVINDIREQRGFKPVR